MKLYNLVDNELYVGNATVDRAYLGSKSIYRKKGTNLIIPRFDYSTIKPEAALVEYDYTNPEGNKLSGTHTGTYQDGGYYQSPLRFFHKDIPELSRVNPSTAGRTMVYEYVLNTPEYSWSGYRSLLHLDLATGTPGFRFNFYLTDTQLNIEYIFETNGIKKDGRKAVSSNKYADGVLVINMAQQTINYNTSTCRVFINGVLVFSENTPTVGYHRGRLNYNSSSASIPTWTRMTDYSAEGILYEAAMYDLDLYAHPTDSQLETLAITNYERAKALYGK